MQTNDALFKKNTAYDVNENSEMLKGTQNYNFYTELRKKYSRGGKLEKRKARTVQKFSNRS